MYNCLYRVNKDLKGLVAIVQHYRTDGSNRQSSHDHQFKIVYGFGSRKGICASSNVSVQILCDNSAGSLFLPCTV